MRTLGKYRVEAAGTGWALATPTGGWYWRASWHEAIALLDIFVRAQGLARDFIRDR